MGRMNIKIAVTNKTQANLPEFRPPCFYPEKRITCQLLFKKSDQNQHKNVNFFPITPIITLRRILKIYTNVATYRDTLDLHHFFNDLKL